MISCTAGLSTTVLVSTPHVGDSLDFAGFAGEDLSSPAKKVWMSTVFDTHSPFLRTLVWNAIAALHSAARCPLARPQTPRRERCYSDAFEPDQVAWHLARPAESVYHDAVQRKPASLTGTCSAPQIPRTTGCEFRNKVDISKAESRREQDVWQRRGRFSSQALKLSCLLPTCAHEPGADSERRRPL